LFYAWDDIKISTSYNLNAINDTLVMLSNLQDHNLFVYQQNFNRDCHRPAFLFNLQKGKLLNEKNL
jgi:hypothetical protein